MGKPVSIVTLSRTGLAYLAWIVLAAIPASAAVNSWTIHGPFGGYVNVIKYDPVNPSIVYAGASGGLFRSTNGGQTWSAVTVATGIQVYDVAVSESNPNVVYMASVWGIYKSTDRGVTWAPKHLFGAYGLALSRQSDAVLYSAQGGGPARSSDGAATFADPGAGKPSGVTTTIVVDPLNADTAYAAFTAGVYKTIDGGATWSLSGTGLPPSFPPYALAIDPANSALYVSGQNGMYKSTDAGVTWTAVTMPQGASAVYSIAISPASTPSTVLVATSNGVYKSTNGGTTWSARMLEGQASAVGIDPTNASNFLISWQSLLKRTTDGGVTLQDVNTGILSFYVMALVADPKDPAVVYAAGPLGVWKSADRGVTWARLAGASSPTYSFAVDRLNPSILYKISDGAVWRSVDSGATFQTQRTGLPASANPSFLVLDPLVSGTVYTYNSGVFYRKAGEAAWTALAGAGFPAGAFPSFLVIDPRNSSTLYTATSANGVLKSTDGGATWVLAGTGLDASVNSVAVDPFDSSHLLASTYSGIYETTDAGAHWAVLPGVTGGTAIVFDPATQGRLYSNSAQRVDLSTDGGKTWSAFTVNGPGKQHDAMFAIGAGGSNLYIGGPYYGVWTYTFGRHRSVSSKQ